MISGVTRPQRRYSSAKITPMMAFPMNPPNPWYRWYEPRTSALTAIALAGAQPSWSRRRSR